MNWGWENRRETRAEEETKGRAEREEQRESRSSRVLQQTTMGKDGRRATRSTSSITVCCDMSIVFDNQKIRTKRLLK